MTKFEHFTKCGFGEIPNQRLTICDALRNLLAFVQFKKREKHSWRSVNFSM